MSISHINPNQLRPSDEEGLGLIVSVGLDRRHEAIARLMGPGPHATRDQARRFIEYARDHRITLDRLWSRLDRQGRVSATVLAVPNPGRTAMLFASHPIGSEQIRSLAGLIDHACLNLASDNVNLAQVLLEPSEDLEREAYHAAGFTDLAILNYLERRVQPSRGCALAAPQWPMGAVTTPYRESLRAVLVQVLDRTYLDTLDCPLLRGHRKTEDILEGHRASGLFDPSLWTLLYVDGIPAGALLLNPSADRHSIELVYLGLAKEMRGRGLGQQLLRHGLKLVEARCERTMNLAVDESNLPAMKLYLREGFKQALRRRALIRPMHEHSSASQGFAKG